MIILMGDIVGIGDTIGRDISIPWLGSIFSLENIPEHQPPFKQESLRSIHGHGEVWEIILLKKLRGVIMAGGGRINLGRVLDRPMRSSLCLVYMILILILVLILVLVLVLILVLFLATWIMRIERQTSWRTRNFCLIDENPRRLW